MCRGCQFPWCKYPHHGWFQADSLTPLNTELRKHRMGLCVLVGAAPPPQHRHQHTCFLWKGCCFHKSPSPSLSVELGREALDTRSEQQRPQEMEMLAPGPGSVRRASPSWSPPILRKGGLHFVIPQPPPMPGLLSHRSNRHAGSHTRGKCTRIVHLRFVFTAALPPRNPFSRFWELFSWL